MLLEFPTENDWKELATAYPYDKLEVSEHLFPYTAQPLGSFEDNAIKSLDLFAATVAVLREESGISK